jgi:hypothetical protein
VSERKELKPLRPVEVAIVSYTRHDEASMDVVKLAREAGIDSRVVKQAPLLFTVAVPMRDLGKAREVLGLL